MKLFALATTLLLKAQTAFSVAPVVTYNDAPEEVWRLPFNAVGAGNGAFLSPDGTVLAVTTKKGLVRAYDVSDKGTTPNVLWTFTPTAFAATGSVRSQSSVNFFEKDSESYLAFAVIEDVPGEDTTSRILVLALSDGTKVLESTALVGEVTYSPQVTRDGRYVAMTHNFNQTGHFSLVETDFLNNSSMSIPPVLQYTSEHMSSNETTPFSDLGFFARPDVGNYVDPSNNGILNNNDLFMWISDTNTDVVNFRGDPVTGDGEIYVFQLPLGYDHSGNGLEVLAIGGVRNYQSSTRPIITNEGRSAYWNMVRGECRAWIDRRFDQSQDATAGFGRGNPPYISPRAPPTISNTGDMVFGPGSSEIVWKTAANLTDLQNVTTDHVLFNRVLVTADDKYIVYGTPSGTLTMASTTNISESIWQVGSYADFSFTSIQGEMALDASGTMLYVATNIGDVSGQVVGISIAKAPTEMPSSKPSASPSSKPSAQPTDGPTAAPSTVASSAPSLVQESAVPSIEPTKIASLETTSAPVNAPTPATQPSELIDDKKTSGAIASTAHLFSVLVGTTTVVLGWLM